MPTIATIQIIYRGFFKLFLNLLLKYNRDPKWFEYIASEEGKETVKSVGLIIPN